MIFYHLCRTADAPRYLAEGLARSEGRHYLFERWEDIRVVVAALDANNTAADHVVLVLDQAGWHLSKGLQVPDNIALLRLPPYSPELNPVERLWAYLRSHYLSNRAYEDYDDLFDSCGAAWNQLTPERLCSICRTQWIPPTNLS